MTCLDDLSCEFQYFPDQSVFCTSELPASALGCGSVCELKSTEAFLSLEQTKNIPGALVLRLFLLEAKVNFQNLVSKFVFRAMRHEEKKFREKNLGKSQHGVFSTIQG